MKQMREVLSILKVIASRYPKITIPAVLCALAGTVSAYLPLVFLGFLTEGLLHRDARMILVCGLLYIGGSRLLEVCHEAVEQLVIVRSRAISEEAINDMYLKLLRIPYDDSQDAGIREKAFQSLDALYYDFSYDDVILKGVSMLQGLMHIALSVAMVVALLFARPAQGTGLIYVLASPGVSAAVALCAILLVVFVQVLVLNASGKKSAQYIREHASVENRLMTLNNEIVYQFAYYVTYAVFRMKHMIGRHYDEDAQDNVAYFMKTRALDRSVQVMFALSAGLFTVISFVLTVIKALAGAIPVALTVTYAQGMMRLYEAFVLLTSSYGEIHKSLQFFYDIEEVLQLKEDGGDNGAVIDAPRTICFDHVSYRYPGADTYALKDVCVTLDAGRKHVAVGVNGSGKTTFLMLLLGLLKPESGTIRLNDTDIATLDPHAYRRLFSCCMQDTDIYQMRLADNIAMQTKADEERILQVLARATAPERLSRKDAVQAEIDPDTLSGGEKQKLSAARAYYRDAPVYVFDEPTAAMDAISEKAFFDGVLSDSLKKFVILVSHRMSCCKDGENILLFADGAISAQGTHASLMSDSAQYRALWDAQASLYTAGEA